MQVKQVTFYNVVFSVGTRWVSTDEQDRGNLPNVLLSVETASRKKPIYIKVMQVILCEARGVKAAANRRAASEGFWHCKCSTSHRGQPGCSSL